MVSSGKNLLGKHFVVRADASSAIGSGHVQRCLTLANELSRRGAKVTFATRPSIGGMRKSIKCHGHRLHMLSSGMNTLTEEGQEGDYSNWLGGKWWDDADEVINLLKQNPADWLIVDHYGIDSNWHNVMRAHTRNIMVIDDLARARQDCDLLLNQNINFSTASYTDLVAADTRLLLGPEYALLRPEFSELRNQSMERRRSSTFRQLLVTLGGADKKNDTSHVLEALRYCRLPKDILVVVVMGELAPWKSEVRALASKLPFQIQILSNVKNMASLMANSDLAIGAAGSSAWERCCLGLPSLNLVLADNQRPIAQGLAATGAARLLEHRKALDCSLRNHLLDIAANPGTLAEMAAHSYALTDGQGCKAVAEAIVEPNSI